MRLHYLFVTISLLAAGCGESSTTNSQSSPESASARYDWEEVVRIKVGRSGQVLVDNSAVTQDELEDRLDQLKRQNGVVWIFQENDSSANAKAVMQAITERQLPYRPFDNDFD